MLFLSIHSLNALNINSLKYPYSPNPKKNTTDDYDDISTVVNELKFKTPHINEFIIIKYTLNFPFLTPHNSKLYT